MTERDTQGASGGRMLTRRQTLQIGAVLSVTTACEGQQIFPPQAEANPPSQALHHILRIHLPLDAAERRTGEVIDYCRRTGCQEVLLFTTSYDHAPSFQPIAELQAYLAAIRPQVERLRAARIVVSVNVLQTLGHVYFPMALQAEFPFQRRIAADGRVSTEGACPLDPKLRDWVEQGYRTYAQLQPPVLFVDDDYRTMMAGGMYCFCPLHLQLMSDLGGKPVTREEVSQALIGEAYPASPLRRLYRDATTLGLVDLAHVIREAVHSVSPQTRIGLMTAGWPTGAQGMDVPQILKALAGEHRPLLRPQIGHYSETFIRDHAATFINPSRFRGVLPEDIEYWPEIENYQYTLYAKSAACTFAQMAACVLQGFNHLALNVFDMFGSPLGDSETLIQKLENGRPFLDRLHTLVPEGSRPLGVRVFEDRRQLLVRRAMSAGGLFVSDEGTRRLPGLGIPVTHGVASPWQMLAGDDVLALSDTELDELLKPGAILDAAAASALALRGQAERIGVQVGEAIPIDELGYEQFSNAEISRELAGRCFPLRPLVQAGDWRRLQPIGGVKTRTASEIRNYKQALVGPALLLTENAQGERFGIFAFSGKGDRHLLENRMRPEQLRSAWSWTTKKPLPVAVHHDAPYLWPILNRTADGRLVIGVVNLSTDVYESLPLLLDKTLASEVVLAVQPQGGLRPVIYVEAETPDSQTVRYEVQQRLEPFEVAALVLE